MQKLASLPIFLVHACPVFLWAHRLKLTAFVPGILFVHLYFVFLHSEAKSWAVSPGVSVCGASLCALEGTTGAGMARGECKGHAAASRPG